jgi:hypothetical protein
MKKGGQYQCRHRTEPPISRLAERTGEAGWILEK